MKYIQRILLAMTFVGSLSITQTSIAQVSQEVDSVKADSTYTEGEVKRIDLSSGKITIKHGFIKSLDMPAMTMVFTVKEKSLLDDITVGDQVYFQVKGDGAKILITDLKK